MGWKISIKSLNGAVEFITKKEEILNKRIAEALESEKVTEEKAAEARTKFKDACKIYTDAIAHTEAKWWIDNQPNILCFLQQAIKI